MPKGGGVVKRPCWESDMGPLGHFVDHKKTRLGNVKRVGIGWAPIPKTKPRREFLGHRKDAECMY